MEQFTEAMHVMTELQHGTSTGSLPTSREHLDHIREILPETLHSSDEEAMRQLESEGESEDPDFGKRRDGLMKKLALHNPWKRKLGIEAVRTQDGTPIFEESEVNAYLANHWGSQFVEKGIDADQARQFVSDNAVEFPEMQLILCFGIFIEMVGALKKSAPGPDGVPYAA